MSLEALPSGHSFPDDESVMRRALLIAQQGLGTAEPNPLVGAVIVDQQRRLIAEGWHARFGSHHAEVNAIRAADGTDLSDARLFVTLEPCSHHGKTPPCANAVIEAGFHELVVGCEDPAPHVAGRGIARVQEAGIAVVTGVCEEAAQQLIAPFAMLQGSGRPWVHAKWAMTLDGRIATTSGHSQWITCEQSREEVHRLRGRMDAIITGAGTMRSDDPLLTARPPGPRTPHRIIVDRDGSSVVADSQVVKSLKEAPVTVCIAGEQPAAAERLSGLGVEVLSVETDASGRPDIGALLSELGRREMTHVLIEAGAGLMGALFDAQLVDEVHVFVAPKIVGGAQALSPVGGSGRERIPQLSDLTSLELRRFNDDVYLHGRVNRMSNG